MSDVQIAVVDQQDTQIVLAVPGVQGATGSEIPTGGTADQVLRKSSSTNYDTNWSQVTSAMIADGTIVNADINASAAIAGTKISPNFGSQNVTTTGTSTAASFIPTSSTVPTNGVYLPAANSVALSTNSTGRLFVDASGNVGVGGTPFNPLDVFGSGTTGIRYKGSGSYAGIVADNSSSTGGGFFSSRQNGTQKAIFGVTGAFIGDTSADCGVFAETGQHIRFFTDGSVTEKVRITSAGLVGIGTSSPGFKLTIEDSTTPRIRIGDGVRHLNVDGGSVGQNAAIGTDYAGSFGIYTDGAANTRFHITSAGLVGIGTTSPGNALHVNGNFQTSSTSDIIFSNNYKSYSSASDFSLIAGSASLVFKTGASDTERARIDSSGRLLVGTSSARSNFYNDTNSARFQVEGTDNDGAAIAVVQNFAANTIGAQLILAKSNLTSVGSNTLVAAGDRCGNVSFQGNDGTQFVEAAAIAGVIDGTPGANDMPGRLVFSVTADGASSPTERMRIGSSGTLYTFVTGNAGNYFATSVTAGTLASVLRIAHSATQNSVDGTVSFQVFSNGNVVNTNNSYGAISDIKLKENIVDANSQWGDIKGLQVRNYNFKEGQTHTQIGLIAQEVELVSPGLVSESPDRDEDGNDLGTVTKSVNYSVLYMKAVKALQEAMERIETLEAKVAALESA